MPEPEVSRTNIKPHLGSGEDGSLRMLPQILMMMLGAGGNYKQERHGRATIIEEFLRKSTAVFEES
jgi:hypothetical protein